MLAILTFAASSILFAGDQTPTSAITTSNPNPSSQNAVLMDPFQVSEANDMGYRSDQANTGSLIAVPLLDSPLTINVINNELINDTNLVRATDILAFTVAGVPNMGRVPEDTEDFTFRGYAGEVLRNGLPIETYTDASNIERIEVAMGPSAIDYGFLSPGGVVNYVTKVPFDGDLYYFQERFGFDNGYNEKRETWDVNIPLVEGTGTIPTVLLRFMGSEVDGQTYLLYQTEHNTFLNPVLSVQLGTTKLTYSFSYRDDKGPFDRIKAYYLYNQNGNGTAADPALPALALAPYNSLLEAEGSNNVGYNVNPGIAPWTTGDIVRRYNEVKLEHTFNEHFAFQGVLADDFSHVNQLTEFSDFTTVRNIGYQNVFLPPPQDILMAIMPIYEDVLNHNQYMWAQLNTKFDFKYFTTNTLFGLYTTRSLPITDDGTRNGFYAPVPSLISTIDYTLKSPYTVTLASPQSSWYYLPPNDPYETWPLWFTQASYYQWGKPDLFATEYLGAFNNRLHILAGVRRELYRGLGITKVLPQFGAIYEIAKGFSIYGIYSQTDISNGLTLRYQQPRPLTTASGGDVGIKYQTADGKLSATVAGWHIRENNVGYASAVLLFEYAQGLSDDTYAYAAGTKSNGASLDLTYQPIPNFQTIFSYAHTKAITLPGNPNDVKDWDQQLPWAVPDAVSFFGKYTVVRGPLKNLAIGGGIAKNWGPIYTDLASGQRGLDIPNGDTVVNAFIRYPVKIYGHTVGFELAGNNLTNDRPIANGGYAEPTEYFVSVDFKY
jgi:outer membrane receptor protein involved in Fe transport